MEPLRVALVGYGLGGSVFHAPLIAALPGLRLAAVVTRNADRQAEVRSRYPDTKILDSPERVWAQAQDFDLAVVTTPNRQHVPLARAALTAGLPVVVDKPLAATAAQARELKALAAERGRPVFPFHNRRFDGDFRTVRRLIDDGSLGTVLRLESRFARWRPQIKPGWKENPDPADAGGTLYDLGSHLVDQAIALFGRPERVYAEVDAQRAGARVPDDAFLALTHPGGVRSHLWMGSVSADIGPRFRVLGDRAAYVTHGLDVQEEQLRAGLTPGDEGYGFTPPESYGSLGTPGSTVPVPTEVGAYQEFYAAVARTLRDTAPPPVSIDDAIAGLEIIEAAQQVTRDGVPGDLRI